MLFLCHLTACQMKNILGLQFSCVQAKLAKLRRELLEPSSGGGGGGKGEGFEVNKVGDARVGLVGFPSVGKSTLLNKMTGTFSEVGVSLKGSAYTAHTCPHRACTQRSAAQHSTKCTERFAMHVIINSMPLLALPEQKHAHPSRGPSPMRTRCPLCRWLLMSSQHSHACLGSFDSAGHASSSWICQAS